MRNNGRIFLILLALSYCDFWTQGLTLQDTSPERNTDALELFAVAPMMGHTNRHYRDFFGRVSKRAWLYTEMLPANRIIQSFLNAASDAENGFSSRDRMLHPEWITEQTDRIRKAYKTGALLTTDSVLEELLNPGPNPAVLQLGGRDPERLAAAAAIGSAFGYSAINLNCGCPSTSVSARATGAALMREPETVARCLERMSDWIDDVNSSTVLSVKHRLGVADAETYDSKVDYEQDDEESFLSCKEFVKTIRSASKLSRIQVHSRVALLGLNQMDDKIPDEKSQSTELWVPGFSSSTTQQKVNHQRAQYQAKRRARQVTLQNRSVPPLRPTVVAQIAGEFPELQVSSNGGIESIQEIQNRVSGTAVIGGMAGRAAINHPCSFAAVDHELWKENPVAKSRHDVLISYSDYCRKEEHRLNRILGEQHNTAKGQWRKEEESIAWHRRRLVAPAFHLFMGERGNEGYQRRLRKLVDRANRHPSSSMILAALQEIPSDLLEKDIYCHTPWKDIPSYDFVKRSGAMQRTIH